MKPKLFKTTIAEYEQAEWNGKNESGWDAFGDHVIVIPDHVPDQSAGGVHYTQDIVDRHTMAAEGGVIVSIGDGCFKWNSNGTPFEGRMPKLGDRVSIGRYSGQALMGHDEVRYRILNSSEIGAIQERVVQ